MKLNKRNLVIILTALFISGFAFSAYAEQTAVVDDSYSDDQSYSDDEYYDDSSSGDDEYYGDDEEYNDEDPAFEIVRSGSLDEIKKALSEKKDSDGNTFNRKSVV